MKLIELGAQATKHKGHFAIVDDEDFEELNQYRWRANWCEGTKSFRATRDLPKDAKGKRYSVFMHRHIMNPDSDLQIDHINHDTLDNRKCNLRIVTVSENAMNRKKRDDLSSKFKGVHWQRTRKKWRTRIKCKGIYISLGYFTDEIEAAKAYDIAARKHFGEFALLNFPEEKEDITKQNK